MKELVIRMTGYILVLTEQELHSLLQHDPALWACAMKRGKGVSRFEKAAKRIGK